MRGQQTPERKMLMATLTIPRLPEDITADWLTDALRSTGTVKNARVASFDMEPDIAAGKGFMGQLARIAPRYDRPEPGAPASMIAKFPTYGPENRYVADLFRLYETETRFYEELADKVELRTPRRYYSARATDSTDFVLLMEDLAPARVGDQVVGCTTAQSQLAIRELAKFHATWWESPRLAELDWVWTFNNPIRSEAAVGGYMQAWEPFKQIWSKQVPAAVLDLGEKFPSRIPQLLDRLAAPPVTISHGDYRIDNLFFATPEGGDPLAVVDWQVMSIGNGLFDLAYFLSGAVAPADRRAMEMDLLHMYHDILLERGVKDYGFDQCLLDYRTSALFCWQYAVIILGSLDTANERGLALFNDVLARFVAAIVDLDAGELLPA
jgi:thiamine kinase-like enzyme